MIHKMSCNSIHKFSDRICLHIPFLKIILAFLKYTKEIIAKINHLATIKLR